MYATANAGSLLDREVERDGHRFVGFREELKWQLAASRGGDRCGTARGHPEPGSWLANLIFSAAIRSFSNAALLASAAASWVAKDREAERTDEVDGSDNRASVGSTATRWAANAASGAALMYSTLTSRCPARVLPPTKDTIYLN